VEITILLQLFAVGILVMVAHSVLKQADKEEFGWMVTIGGLAMVLIIVIRLVRELLEAVQTLFML
jgi:stage III sporulation protein AC